MARVKIELPASFRFSTHIPIRITDINYGGHVGNDTILSIVHEARMQFFTHFGYTEMNLAGAGMIMADAAIEFKGEVFYGDVITASVTATNFTRIGFDLFYKLEIVRTDNKTALAALVKTGMICYDYQQKKIISVPEEVKEKLLG
jgi:acyl-CoA thioester hydrolase